MNNKVLAGLSLGVIIIFLIMAFFLNQTDDYEDQMVDKTTQVEDSMQVDTTKDEEMMEDATTETETTSRYLDYSETTYAENSDKKRVLFFHAKWCPTCRVAETEFLKRLDEIPEDVVVLKTDYDQETALKSKYGITYQHTFVEVDAQGNTLSLWNGGDIDELISNKQ